MLFGELKVARLYSGQSDNVLSDEEIVSLATVNASHILGWHDQVGTVEVGKWADLVILEKNPRTTKPENIMDIKVDSTYLAGVLKWQSPEEKIAS